MTRLARLPIALGLAAALAGCVEIDMLVKVKGDGSRTLEKRLTVNPRTLEEMKANLEKAGFKPTEPAPRPGTEVGGPARSVESLSDEELLRGGLFDREALQKDAQTMGPGVSFVSAVAIRAKERVGVKATYAFQDVSTLRFSQKPAAQGAARPPGGPAATEDDVTFRFTRQPNGHAVLRMANDVARAMRSSQPAPRPTAAPPPPGAEKMAEGMGEALVAMLKPFLKGLRMTIAVEVDGTIVQTSSPYRDGARVIYADMDFDALLADPAALKQLAPDLQGPLERQKQALARVKGMRINLDPEVTIEFKPN
jgi:hypothetical protein